ncbi:hypothetical protein GALMADRAFT_1316984 [Galerina marginata CBS 339.88]|uniref:Uncharacterized protein n=1 Tax=Galerina marginata (strain CBS 339.88) TaxID=685588 RepID=A0A067THA6_GALM3|nr:hypothetical protein GALMADRAFT_1316984 [Galerina marginata CBS 339.88]
MNLYLYHLLDAINKFKAARFSFTLDFCKPPGCEFRSIIERVALGYFLDTTKYRAHFSLFLAALGACGLTMITLNLSMYSMKHSPDNFSPLATTAEQVAVLALKVAREQIPALQVHKERCTLLINRTQRLLEQVSAQYETDKASLIQQKLNVLESVCISIRDTISELAGKGLAWRLLHQEQMEKALVVSESRLTDAFFAFQVGANFSIVEIQAEIVEASKRDQQQLISYLDGISQNDQRIIDALRANNLRLEETLLALMKVFELLYACIVSHSYPNEASPKSYKFWKRRSTLREIHSQSGYCAPESFNRSSTV